MNEKRDCNKTATAALAGNPNVGHGGVHNAVFTDALALLNDAYHYKKRDRKPKMDGARICAANGIGPRKLFSVAQLARLLGLA